MDIEIQLRRDVAQVVMGWVLTPNGMGAQDRANDGRVYDFLPGWGNSFTPDISGDSAMMVLTKMLDAGFILEAYHFSTGYECTFRRLNHPGPQAIPSETFLLAVCRAAYQAMKEAGNERA